MKWFLSIDNGNGENLSREIFEWISDIPSTRGDVWNSGYEISLLRLYFAWYLPVRTEFNYKTEPFLL